MHVHSPFRSYVVGGFECSTHRRNDGRRLDLLASTRHDDLAAADYRQLRSMRIRTVRDGVRWHLIERSVGRYDWSSFLPMLRAARDADVQVIWDLCHYGWPDFIDIWSPAFVERFGSFSAAVARLVREETGCQPFYCPINEISFWAWSGAEVGHFNPGTIGRGGELKRQLVRASIAAIDAIRGVDPRARFAAAEPLIHVTAASNDPVALADAEAYRLAQYEALDLLAGRMEPGLGGRADCLDIVGVNFYPNCQWVLGGPAIWFGHHGFRPLHEMLAEVHTRYDRPVFIAETGAEGSARASWLHYVCAEVRIAMARGTPVLGVCLYPVLDYPGWDNERPCNAGLLSAADGSGMRAVCAALLQEMGAQQSAFEAMAAPSARLRAVP